MAVITGKDGAISLGGGAVNGKVTLWELEVTSKNVENDGAGDARVTRTHLREDFTIRGEAYALDQADWDLDQALVGTSSAIALKRKSADTNPYASTTALITRFTVRMPASDNGTFTFEAQCDGTAITYDNTPA